MAEPDPTPAPDPTPDPTPAPEATKPDWCADKFWDAKKGEVRTEALAKSHGEAERKISQSKPDGPQIPTALPGANDDTSLDDIIAASGFEKQDLARQFLEHGEFTDDQYAKFKELTGLGKTIMNGIAGDQLADGQRTTDAAIAKAVANVGGQQQYDNLMQWAATSLTDAEKADINKMLNDPTTLANGVDALLAKQQRAVAAGDTTPLASGDTGPTAAAAPYASQTEWMAGGKAQGGEKAQKLHIARMKISTPFNELPIR